MKIACDNLRVTFFAEKSNTLVENFGGFNAVFKEEASEVQINRVDGWSSQAVSSGGVSRILRADSNRIDLIYAADEVHHRTTTASQRRVAGFPYFNLDTELNSFRAASDIVYNSIKNELRNVSFGVVSDIEFPSESDLYSHFIERFPCLDMDLESRSFSLTINKVVALKCSRILKVNRIFRRKGIVRRAIVMQTDDSTLDEKTSYFDRREIDFGIRGEHSHSGFWDDVYQELFDMTIAAARSV